MRACSRSRSSYRHQTRALAYRAAYALSLADEESSDGEFEFDLQLLDALDLSQAEADRLVGEVDGTVR